VEQRSSGSVRHADFTRRIMSWWTQHAPPQRL